MSEEEIEEVPFKSIKMTLSDEAISKLGVLRARGVFRSDSATVEECIRAMYDISNDIIAITESTVRSRSKKIPMNEQAESLRRIGMRISRFIRLSEEAIRKFTT